MSASFDVETQRKQFPALARSVEGRTPVYLDGPAGSQVPHDVIDAMTRYLKQSNANVGGVFRTSRETAETIDAARRAMADLLGATDADEVAFGPNMTTLTLSLSRALAHRWGRGDEVLVSRLDHDANFTPWVLAAQSCGATVQHVDVDSRDSTLRLDDLEAKLSPRTRLVAVTCASNAVGSLVPVERIVARAHAVGAEVFLDAVHLAPHRLVDVTAWRCDYLVCSAYKFFGPHIGVLWGKREHLETLKPDKLRPASDALPWRWETGTQSHEAIAGAQAAVDYLAGIGTSDTAASPARRDRLRAAFDAIVEHETALCRRLLSGLRELPEYRVHGIDDLDRLDDRVPTIAVTHARRSPRELAEHLATREIYAWSGNFYALPLTEALGLEPDGVLRLGLLHYNTSAEVDRVLEALGEL